MSFSKIWQILFSIALISGLIPPTSRKGIDALRKSPENACW